MEAKDYLYFIVHDIHTTVVATVDDAGLPVTCAIDMMDSDGNSLYFLNLHLKIFQQIAVSQSLFAESSEEMAAKYR